MLIEGQIVSDEIIFDGIRRLEQNADAGGLKMPIVVFDSGVHVAGVAFARSELSRDANGELAVDHRDIDRPLSLAASVVAGQQLTIAFECLEAGTPRLEQVGASRRIPAEERSLASLVH